MKKGISIREFARREGVSDTLVHKALKQRRLKTLPDKTIDPKFIGSPWRMGNAIASNAGANPPSSANPLKGANTQAGANPSSTAKALPPPPKIAGPGKKGKAGAKDPPPYETGLESLEEAAERMLVSGQIVMLPYGAALEKKENYLALLRQLEYEEKSGALVDIEIAERVIFNGGRAMRDAWLNWPTRVGALIAADLGLEADRVTEILTTHVHKHIEQLGDPDVQFRQG